MLRPIALLTMLTAAALGADTPPTTAPVSLADAILSRTNAARRKQKLAELKADPRLAAAAQGLADHMARTGQFSHQADGRTPAQRVEAQQYQWTFVAENIAFRSDAGISPDDTARLLMEQWLTSPGHRQNILSPQATQFGAATAQSTNGAVYGVQVFAAPAASTSPQASP